MNTFLGSVKRLRFGIILAVVLLASAGAGAWAIFPEYFRGAEGVGIGHASGVKHLSNDRKLAGYGDSIFFGQVKQELG